MSEPIKIQGRGTEIETRNESTTMTCKHLKTTIEVISGGQEVGGSPFPQGIKQSICELGRQPTIIGWATRCEKTPEQGPCWWWVNQQGDKPDLEF